MNPKETGISFIIPCYNCEKTLVDTFKSIISLDLVKFEICMVDDGSVDSTWEFLQNYKKRYPDIVKIGKNEKNKGGAYTRNECVKLSQYEWLFVIDSDNYLNKKSFYRLIDNITKYDKVVAFQKVLFFYDFFNMDVVYKKWIYKKKSMDFNDLRRTSYHPVVDGNNLIHRSVFDKVLGYDCNPEFGVLDTWAFGYKILLNNYKIKIVENTFYYHRVTGNSYWVRGEKDFSNSLKNILLSHSERFSKKEIEEIKKSENTQKTLITLPNDFVAEYISYIFRVLLKVFYTVKRLKNLKKCY